MHTHTTAYRHLAVVAVVVVLLLGFAATPPSGAELTPDHPGQGQSIDPGTVLVRRTPSQSQPQGRAPQWVAVPVRPGENPEQAVERLNSTPGIDATSLNYHYELFAVPPPNDPYFPDQWHLSDAGIPDAWEFSEGHGVTLAIIDTGVSAGGIDLACHPFRYPYNSATGAPSAEPQPGYVKGSHGTHVAGTALQCSGNGIRTAGMAPGADLMPVRVSDAGNGITSLYLADGIIWAADHGADVINMSLGRFCISDWPSCGEDDQALNDAIDYAASKDIVIVSASGNSSRGFVSYPANHPAVIAVGATTITRSLADYSNEGSALALVAPGGGDEAVDGILQESFDDTTGAWGVYAKVGTSFASPLVAGTAALMRAANPTLSSATIREILTSTALDLGIPGWDSTYGAGLLQAHAAVAEAAAVEGPAMPESEALFSACPENTSIPDAGFTDVPAASNSFDAINCFAYYKVTAGTTPDTYGPSETVSRAQMAVFLARMAADAGVVLSSNPPDAGFTDLAGLSVEAQDAINALAAKGIISGTSATTYDPTGTVSRTQMALFLTRFSNAASAPDHGPGGEQANAVTATTTNFTDLGTAGDEAKTAITRVFHLGVASGTTATTYDPTGTVSRAQMALFMTRLMGHMNTRPVGVVIQANPMIVEDVSFNPAVGPMTQYSVTVRTADFSPAAGVHVDAFKFAAPNATDTPFKTDGTCDPTKAALADPGGSPVCQVSSNDRASDTYGNFATTTIPIESAFLPLYAWTGDDLAIFNTNVTTFSSVVIDATSTTS